MILLRQQLTQMARYHAWATERMLASIAPMPHEAYFRPCGLFFGSIHGTLNHLLLTDGHIWYRRFVGEPLSGLALDSELATDRNDLASQLLSATQRWEGYIANLDEAALVGELHYSMTTGQAQSLPMASALLHVFNHGTHHRGQITAAVTMLGFNYQPLDLPFMIFEQPTMVGVPYPAANLLAPD